MYCTPSKEREFSFARGERNSLSVRLRCKRDVDVKKKRNRHSGDFYSSSTEPEDWSFITFPHDSVSPKKLSSEKEIPIRTPIKVITRNVPGLSLSSFIEKDSDSGKIEKAETETEHSHLRRRRSEDFKLSDSKKNYRRSALPSLGSEVKRLGTRSVTQISLSHNKKTNSYSCALAKSQENLSKCIETNLDKDNSSNGCNLKKGLLWQQRDKLFSRWKERYFILTADYLHCFKKETSRITEMGGFIYKIKFSDVEDVELLDKRGYLTICISCTREGKVYLRRTEGIRDWYNLLKQCIRDSKQRRKNQNGFWSRKQMTDSSNIDNWIQARKKIGLQYAYSGSSPEIHKLTGNASSSRDEITLDELSILYAKEEAAETAEAAKRKSDSNALNKSSSSIFLKEKSQTKKNNRLSLMSDIELSELYGSSEVDKGSFTRKKSLFSETESFDSGHNSLNTNGSVGSSKSSHSHPERLETHLENDAVPEICSGSRYLSGLQITHV